MKERAGAVEGKSNLEDRVVYKLPLEAGNCKVAMLTRKNMFLALSVSLALSLFLSLPLSLSLSLSLFLRVWIYAHACAT